MREAPAAPYSKAVYLYQIAGYLPRGTSGAFFQVESAGGFIEVRLSKDVEQRSRPPTLLLILR
jgi:hypothetical protein